MTILHRAARSSKAGSQKSIRRSHPMPTLTSCVELTTTLRMGGTDDAVRARLESFVGDYRSETTEHPFVRQFRVWQGCVLFEVQPFDGRINLSYIQSIDRGHGHCSAGLDWFMQLARKHGVRVSGGAKQLGWDGLTRRKLKLWYERHGIEVSRFGERAFDSTVQRTRDVIEWLPALFGARSKAP